MLGQVRGRLNEQKIELVISDDVRDFLLQEGYDEEYGARPLRRAIQTNVDDALADALLNGVITSGQPAYLSMQDGKIFVSSQEYQPVV